VSNILLVASIAIESVFQPLHYRVPLWCRWGIGHSTGLLLVGGIFILKDYLQSRGGGNDEGKDPIDIPDSVGHFFESLVGLFMISLGVYGLRSAFQKRRQSLGGIPLVSEEDEAEHIAVNVVRAEVEAAASDAARYRDDQSAQVDNDTPGPAAFHDEPCDIDTSQNALEVDSYQSSTSSISQSPSIVRWTRHFSTKTLALFAGIVHGLAGPGGVLGIVPAVQLHDWKLASCYLGSFCISSTLTMGIFACTYGTLSSFVGQKKNWDFQIQCFSAILSLAVGITWLVLLSLGKLEDVFP
jgi:hypothetical protein